MQSFPELLPSIFPQAAPALVARFREREETVKADIFSTFTDLIRQVPPPCGGRNNWSLPSYNTPARAGQAQAQTGRLQSITCIHLYCGKRRH